MEVAIKHEGEQWRMLKKGDDYVVWVDKDGNASIILSAEKAEELNPAQ